MKKELCFVLALIMLCIATGTALAADELADAVCLEQGFSTKAPAGLNTVYEEENGLRISVGTPGKVPFVLISRRPLELKFKDPVNYLNNVYREYMENTYGDKMIGTNPCREYEVGGKKLLGARYMYKVQDYTLCLLRLIEVRDDGDVEYSAKYIDGKGEATLSVLETAIKYYEVQDKTNDHLLCITDGRNHRSSYRLRIDHFIICNPVTGNAFNFNNIESCIKKGLSVREGTIDDLKTMQEIFEITSLTFAIPSYA